jgi:hypothetical protein
MNAAAFAAAFSVSAHGFRAWERSGVAYRSHLFRLPFHFSAKRMKKDKK